MKAPDLPPVTLKLDTPENVRSTAHELGAALCAFLEGWTYAPPPSDFRWLTFSLIGPDGVRLNIAKQNGAPRLSIMACLPEPWPRAARIPDDRPSITVDATHNPRRIARAIAARLFPETIDWTLKAKANADEARAYATAGTTTRAMLAEFNVTGYREDGDCTGTVSGSYVRAQPNGDRVRLTIDTDATQARAIFDAMNANPRKN
jgi:hypothetical protein